MKKIAILFILTSITFFTNCTSEESEEESKSLTYEGFMRLRSQQEVDDFANEGYVAINGSLLISGEDITNVDALSTLTYIDGFLGISENKSSLNLDGLRNVTHVGENLSLMLNEGDIDLNGLGNIKTIGDYLLIQWNNELTSLVGLNQLEVGETVTVKENNKLTSLNGLGQITSGSYWVIDDNPSLSDLCALLDSMLLNSDVFYYITHGNLNNTSPSSLNENNCSLE